MDLVRKIYHASETKQAEGVDRTLIVKITTKTPDRSKDIVYPEGAVLDNYLKNPVVAAFHRYNEPSIGKTLEIQKTDDGIMTKVEFTPAGVNPLADQLYELYKGGFMNAWSIGFTPIESDEREGGGREFKKWELLEYSAVLVPDNPEALTVMRQKGLNPDEILKEQEEAEIETKSVIPYKETPKAPEDAEWDAAREVREAEVEDLKIMCTWYDSENPDIKSSYKLPHHKAKGEHAVVWRGVAAAMAALLGARGGVDIPDKDRKGVFNHLARHYKDFDKEPPEFRSYKEEELTKMFSWLDEKKEGRVLSEKNRGLISVAITQMKKAIAALDDLLKATEPQEGDKSLKIENNTKSLLFSIRNSLRKNDKDVGLLLRQINNYLKNSNKKGGEKK